jgi:hypothetical protein
VGSSGGKNEAITAEIIIEQVAQVAKGVLEFTSSPLTVWSRVLRFQNENGVTYIDGGICDANSVILHTTWLV